eukprot:TRINITY_DN2736_c0_g1_i2.p1 TRINITY_DN2736_c0_g1~~TRINITY_DN2736_c0_g1_i2.p1  ORF type:complete len:189 (-),score=60.31 TRINITY_DN2736_c0_g1_i2:355-921(-)
MEASASSVVVILGDLETLQKEMAAKDAALLELRSCVLRLTGDAAAARREAAAQAEATVRVSRELEQHVGTVRQLSDLAASCSSLRAEAAALRAKLDTTEKGQREKDAAVQAEKSARDAKVQQLHTSLGAATKAVGELRGLLADAQAARDAAAHESAPTRFCSRLLAVQTKKPCGSCNLRWNNKRRKSA